MHKIKRNLKVCKMVLATMLFALLSNFAMAQVQVSGTVSSSGQPIPGASVSIRGTTTGTITDIDGKYTINAVSGDVVLVYSFVGYEKQEVPVQGRSKIDVELVENVLSLSDVVVIGYGTVKKSDLTGSVASVTGEEIARMPVVGVEQALQGRAAGVHISQNSGAPGSPMMVRVRGTGTIGNSDPLYVVDGMPVGHIGFLNPSDIASIEILKDASAAAIYGARAANGVVLISTKKGESGRKGQVTYSGYRGIQNLAKRYEVLNGSQLAEIHVESYLPQGRRSPFHAKAFNAETGNYDFSVYDEGTDWLSEILNTNAPIQNHHLSVNGGNDGGNYMLSFGQFKQEGIVIMTGIERYTFRLNSDYKVNKWLDMGVNMTYVSSKVESMRENDEHAPLTEALRMDPNVPVYDERDEFIWATSPIGVNPVASLNVNNTEGTTKYTNLIGNVYANIKISKDLQLRSSYGITNNNSEKHVFLPTYNMDRADQQRAVSELQKYYNQSNNWVLENTLTYNKLIGEKHSVTALLGNMAYYNKWANTRINKYGTLTDEPIMQHLSSAVAEEMAAFGSFSETTMVSYLARAIYSFDDMLLVTASIRRDGSSLFGPDNRYGNFPSISAGWKLSSLEYFKQFAFLDMLKLRAGWGSIGNNQIALNQFSSSVEPSPNFRYTLNDQIVVGAAPMQAGNSALKWESSEQKNVGLDVNLFNNRLQINADYYVKNTRDLLLRLPVPMIVGTKLPPTVNAGDIMNKGFELYTSFRKNHGDFTYDISANFATLKNEVISLGEGGTTLYHGNFNRSDVGYPLGYFYGYVMDGIFQNEEEVLNHATQPNAGPGDVRYKDLNNDGVINDQDQEMIGSFHPDFTYGFNVALGYKGFDFIAFLQGSYGNDVYNNLDALMLRGGRDNLSVKALDRWTGEGTSNTVSRILAADRNRNDRVSSRFIEDASFLRIKNVQLGYTLPSVLTQKVAVDRARLYVSAQNLYTFTKYSGMDPEIAGDNRPYGTSTLGYGIDRGNYPISRTFLMGVEISF